MGLEEVAKMEYPGRFIVLGTSPNRDSVIVYGITGRSESSKARAMVIEDFGGKAIIQVRPSDEKIIRKGNLDLLVYPAIITSQDQCVVSNGKQTSDLLPRDSNGDSMAPILDIARGHISWEFEPDSPNFTPRISGKVAYTKDSFYAGLGIIREEEGIRVRSFFEVPVVEGVGKFISTYSGENKDPLPSFESNPIKIALTHKNAFECAEFFYNLFRPEIRVSVAAIYTARGEKFFKTHHYIRNRVDR